ARGLTLIRGGRRGGGTRIGSPLKSRVLALARSSRFQTRLAEPWHGLWGRFAFRSRTRASPMPRLAKAWVETQEAQLTRPRSARDRLGRAPSVLQHPKRLGGGRTVCLAASARRPSQTAGIAGCRSVLPSGSPRLSARRNRVGPRRLPVRRRRSGRRET